jgi:hypothetical protein
MIPPKHGGPSPSALRAFARDDTRAIAAALAVLHLCTACYAYAPVRTTPHVGAHVALEVNDDGRVALRDRLGPGVVRLEGKLAAVEGDDLVLDASRVTQIRGMPLPLDSVRLRVNQHHVDQLSERRLSRKRTYIVVGAAVAVVAAFGITKGFSSRGTPPEDGPGGPTTNQRRAR